MFAREPQEFGKAFFKRAAHPSWIPDEMPDSKGSEIFSGIPGGEPSYRTIALVLPDPFPNVNGVGLGNIDWGRCLADCRQQY